MQENFTEVDLTNEEKKLILELADFYIMDRESAEDLRGRKKWIRLKRSTISNVIGELSYYFNRCESDRKSMLLDSLICHLEVYEK